MLRKFICKVTHYNLGEDSVEREHVVYMPESEYDTSGARYKNHKWVEDKLEEKLGKRYTNENPYSGRYYVTRIYQERI